MTQYVGVIRKDMSAFMTPQGVQLQQNLDDKNKVRDMKPEVFGQIGVKTQERYQQKNPQPVETGGVLLYDAENNPTSQVPNAMATRAVEETARRRGVRGQKIGQGIGGAIGVLGGLVSLANAGAAGQDAITGLGQAYQTGEYGVKYAKPRLGNFVGSIGAHTARPVKVTRQKTFDEAPMVASPTNTPAPTPAPVAVEQPRNLPSDPRQIFNTNYAGVQAEQDKAMTMLGNPHYREGEYSAVNTTDEQGRNINLPGAGPAINTYDATAINPDQLSPVTPAGTLRLTNPDGTRYQSPQRQVAVAEPTVPQTPSVNQVAADLSEAFNPGKTGAQEQIDASKESAEDVGNALKESMKKAEILGRQAAYDDFVKMFVEVKS